MSIRALLFDKDGTLFDFHGSWGPWLNRFLLEMAKDDAHMHRMAKSLGFDPVVQRFLAGSVFVHDTLEEIMDAILPHLEGWTRKELEAFAIRETALVPQVPTNDNEHPAKTQLQAAGVLEDFDFVAGYDSGYGGKPGTGMQHAFCAAHKLAPAEVAMVGDSLHDITSGRDAGMATIAVLTGTTSHAELEAVADVVLEDISHIENWLNTL